MTIENSKAHEIKRLTTPLTFKDSKAYDEDGNIINCVETIHDVRYILEPREGILTDDEILKYAPKSKAASKVRLKRGIGNLSDALLINESLPWISGLYYVILTCITISILSWENKYALLVILVLYVIPLIYMYRVFNLNTYLGKETKAQKTSKKQKLTSHVGDDDKHYHHETGVESLKKYEREINNLKIVFEVKEEVVRDLIKKRFTPPQITYDKFIAMIDSSHKLFYKQADAASNIINLAAEDTPRVQSEINKKIDAMHAIIDQIEDLTNELVININEDDNSSEDVKNLLDDMENLIDSVKEY